MSRRNPEKKRRPTAITIPQRVSPYVKLVFTEMRRQAITYDEVEAGSGVLRATLKAWRHKNKPSLDNVEAALGFLGWDFVAVPRGSVLPKPLVDALLRIAAEHGQTLDASIEQLIGVVSGVHSRFPIPAPERRPAAAATDPEAPPPPRRVRASRVHPDQAAFLDFEAIEAGAVH